MVKLQSHSTVRTVHTTYAAALKTTIHPQTQCRKPYAATQHLMLLMMGISVTRHRPHRTHDLCSGSQDHHPSTNSVQKTVRCNSTSNATDDGDINHAAPSAPYTRPMQRLSRPPSIHKLSAENRTLQLNI